MKITTTMKKQTTLLLSLVALFNTLCIHAQNEIDLLLDKAYPEKEMFLFDVTASNNSKITVKYLSFPTACVKSDDETTMNGRVLSSKGMSINGYLALSDIVMVLTEQELDVATKTSINTKNHLIALRNVDAAKIYKLLLEGIENKLSYLKDGMVVPYNNTNVTTIPNLTDAEAKYLQSIFDHFSNGNSKSDLGKNMLSSTKEFQGFKSLLGDLQTLQQTFKLPTDNENTLKYDVLDNDVEYLITRDRRIKKDDGVAYKSYFVYDKQKLVKVDSVFFADKSKLGRPEKVFDVTKNSYSAVLSRLECEPLVADKKSDYSYFRYTYFDKDKNVKRYRFQIPGGKLNLFDTERVFKIGDTLVHLTTKKTGFLKQAYESSVFMNDSLHMRYPLVPKDTIKFETLYCGKGVGCNGFFGTEKRVFINEKVGNRYFLVEQETVSKSSANIVPATDPTSNEMGFSLTKVYTIYNNAVQNISRISVPYFSKSTSKYTTIVNDGKKGVYMVSMAYPVFFIFDASGGVKLKEANVGSFTPQTNPVTNKYTFDFNNATYLIYRDAATGKSKLIKTEF
jgi:hypothetical protein